MNSFITLFKKSYLLLVIILFSNLNVYSDSNTGLYQFLSPGPNAIDVYPEHSITIRFGDLLDQKSLLDNSLIEVTGDKTGSIKGRIVISTDNKTLLFYPDKPFKLGEKVTVNLKNGISTINNQMLPAMNYSFQVLKQDNRPTPEEYYKLSVDRYMEDCNINNNVKFNYKNTQNRLLEEKGAILPDSFPVMKIYNGKPTTPGYIFIAPFGGGQWFRDSTNWMIIMDNNGIPVLSAKTQKKVFALTMQQGLMTFYGLYGQGFFSVNDKLEIVNQYNCGNGYGADMHDFRLLPNGNSFVLAYPEKKVLLTSGDSSRVAGLIIQELDVNKNVIFEWNAWDHFQFPYDEVKDTLFDWIHCNAIEVESDTSILISSRHLDEITKIDRRTGDIIWRFGGKHNQFELINDDRGFQHQHDIRRLPNGDITFFDNGVGFAPEYSRAVEYKLDEEKMTAELVKEYDCNQENFALIMGNVQTKANGSKIIGWGSGSPQVTELGPDGEKVFEIEMPRINYRAYRFQWQTGIFSTNVEEVDFGEIINGEKIQDVTITNNTDSILTLSGAFTLNSAFTVENQFPLNIEAGGQAKISIKFKPDVLQAEKDYSTKLTINYNRDDGILFARQVLLKGIGTVGVDDMSRNEHFTIYPNPAGAVFNIKIPAGTILRSYKVVDNNGRVIISENGLFTNRFIIDLGNESAGTYFINMDTADGKTITGKLIRE